MKFFLTIACALLVSYAFAQNFKEKELKTEIKEVTVFLQGAQIFETGSLTVPQGNSIIQIKNLSSFADQKSLQVKATGAFTILSVNYKLNYLSQFQKSYRTDSLFRLIELLEMASERENARLEVLKEKQSVLNENKKLSGQNSSTTTLQIKQAIDFYEAEVSKIKEEELKIRRSVESKNIEVGKLRNELRELQTLPLLPSGEIEIRTQADGATPATFSISYIVANAGWYPKYDVRVKDIQSPLQLVYKAELFQNTGIDWKNVKLRFSNANPNQTGNAPELNPWLLNYARNTIYNQASIYGSRAPYERGNVKGIVMNEEGQPLPGVNVLVKGTTIGTTTDASGGYSLTLPNNASILSFSFIGLKSIDVPVTQSEISIKMETDDAQLEEVVVTGYAAGSSARPIRIRGTSSVKNEQQLLTHFIENQTTVEIEVATPYSVKSNGEKIMVELKNYSIEAYFQYYAIPKLDKDAFLVAEITDWDQYNLLEGEVNLYFENAFVGRSVLDAKALRDTLSISLGRDKNIVIGRQKNEQFSKRKILGSNITETIGFKISIRNKKSQAIKINILDQIPVSILNDITITPLEISKAKLEEKTGKVSWELVLEPQQQKELMLQYEVKYPKRERVLLE